MGQWCPGREALLWAVFEKVTLQVERLLGMTRPWVCPWELVSEKERTKKPLVT